MVSNKKSAIGKKYCSVIMCDLIESRKSDNVANLNEKFNRTVAKINSERKKEIISPLTITLGDEFQGITKSLKTSFLIGNTVKLNLLLYGIKSRIVIGQVNLDTKVNTKEAWNMMGAGLPESRDLLNNKSDSNEYKFSILTKNADHAVIAKLLNGIGLSLTSLENKWSEKQLLYISKLVFDSKMTVKTLAKKMQVSVFSIYAALEAGNYNLHRQQISTICETLDYLEGKN